MLASCFLFVIVGMDTVNDIIHQRELKYNTVGFVWWMRVYTSREHTLNKNY